MDVIMVGPWMLTVDPQMLWGTDEVCVDVIMVLDWGRVRGLDGRGRYHGLAHGRSGERMRPVVLAHGCSGGRMMSGWTLSWF